jgi:hypothetical protein
VIFLKGLACVNIETLKQLNKIFEKLLIYRKKRFEKLK